MIVIELLCVVFGIGYIIYKCAKEQKYVPLCSIVSLIVIAGIALLLVDAGIPKILLGVLFLLSPVVIIVLVIIIGSKAGGTQEQIQSKKKADLVDKFAHYGYRIDNDVLDGLISDPQSPINNNHGKEATLYECYKWMCKKYTWEIDKLKGESLSEALGVPLEAIPLDETLPVGEAYLQRTLLAQNYLLMQKGLEYHAFADNLQYRYEAKYLNKKSEYYALFNNFVDKYIVEHQQTTDTP